MAIKIHVTALACALLSLAMTASAQQLTPAEEGRRLFLANNCYGCHGGRAGGSSFGAPQFRRERPELGDLTEAIREGEDRGMPAFPNLNNTTAINNLYAYLQTLGTSSEPIFNRWWEPMPTAGLTPTRAPFLYASTRQKTASIARSLR